MLGIENSSFGNIPNVMVVLLLKLSMPNLDIYQEVYREHRELEKIQMELMGAT